MKKNCFRHLFPEITRFLFLTHNILQCSSYNVGLAHLVKLNILYSVTLPFEVNVVNVDICKQVNLIELPSDETLQQVLKIGSKMFGKVMGLQKIYIYISITTTFLFFLHHTSLNPVSAAYLTYGQKLVTDSTFVRRLLPLQRCSRRILQPQLTGPRNDNTIDIVLLE